MIDPVADVASLAGEWLNDNQGVLSVAIFGVTLAFGWLSGIFSALRRKPKFTLGVYEGPTFCCTFPTGEKHGAADRHRTAIALYLSVSNTGSAPSSIEGVSVAYRLRLGSESPWWKRVRWALKWVWLREQVASLTDFQAEIGAKIKAYPFLTQKGQLLDSAQTYLDVERHTSGVVYFEHHLDSLGTAGPREHKGRVQVKMRVRDVFGKNHDLLRSDSVSKDERQMSKLPVHHIVAGPSHSLPPPFLLSESGRPRMAWFSRGGNNCPLLPPPGLNLTDS